MQEIATIIAYLNGELTGEPLTEFERRLATDPELQSAVKDYRVILEGFRAMRYETTRREIAGWQIGLQPADEAHELLMAYLEGRLDEPSVAALEDHLAADPDLRERLTHLRTAIQGLKGMRQEAFSEEVKAWADALPAQPEAPAAKVVALPKKNSRVRRYAAAAILLALVAVSLWIFQPFDGADFSYTAFRQDNYVEPAPFALVRGNEATLGLAARAFARGDYDGAVESLLTIPASDSLFAIAQYLLGHSYYQSGQYRPAVEAFTQSLAASSDDRYDLRDFNRDNAAWTRILAQMSLAEEDPRAGKQLQTFLSDFLEQADPADTYIDKARKLREQLSGL